MASIELQSILHWPDYFYIDNPFTSPSTSFSSNTDDYYVTDCPFHCHVMRDSKDDVKADFYAAHILWGESGKRKIGLTGVANSNKFNHLAGAAHLFESHRGPKRNKNEKDHEGTNGDSYSGRCLEMMSDNMVPHPTGVLLGHITPDEYYIDNLDSDFEEERFFNSVARWCTPIGAQWKWSGRGSNNHASSMNFGKVYLIYMDNWFPGRTLYMPLIDNNKFVNSNSFYNGSDPFTISHGSSASTDYHNDDLYGDIVAFAQPEVFDYLSDPFTRAACVGMYIEMDQPVGQGANYDMGREMFDFRFLFDMPNNQRKYTAENSLFVYPAPHTLKEALYGNNVPF